jgi:signal transduction histidine kinase/AmiR/NasT family two-component response regulator
MCRQGMHRLLSGLLAAVCFFALAALPAEADGTAPARRVVRVGLPDTDMAALSEGGNATMIFQKEYLQAVAEYANWDYDYVEASWSDCLEMVQSGELDVLLDVSKTDDRAQYLDYSNESMGTEMCCLVAQSDTDMAYDDYSAFDGMTVGYEDGSTLVDSLRRYGAEMGFAFTATAYESSTELYAALDAGEIDALIQTNYIDIPAGHAVLAKCDPSPVYIVTSKKSPELKPELDNAMAHLFSYSPSFNADLYQKSFEDNTAQIESFTRQELAYLSTRPVVIVPYETNWAPFEMDVRGEAAGITPDILRAIGRDTGITFRFVLSSSTQAIYSGMDGGSADTVMAVSYDYLWANSHDLLVTQPYVNGSVMQVMKSADVTPRTVAVVADGYLENEIRQEYPDLEPIEYQTFEECMNAVRRGAADCAFLNYYQANYYRSISAFRDFSYRPVEAISQSIALGVTRESNPVLLGILSKSLERISAGQVQSILSENAVQAEPLSLSVMMRRYPVQTTIAVGSFSVLLCLLAVLLLSAQVRKRRNLALAEAKKGAEAANLAKSDFLSRMSHDIRTPLNGIIGMTHLAQKQPNPPETADCLAKIDTSSKFLLGLVNEILDMSKAESGKMELHPEPYYMEDFKSYLDAVIRPLCYGKNQRLILETHILGTLVPKMDILRTNQIYFNLLSNAVKFTPEGGEIRVTISECQISEDKVRITVSIRDNGIGMSDAFQKVLFDPFSQEHRSDSSELRGTGLGLAIVKKTIDAMHGTISVKSRIGEGTEFVFALDCEYLAARNEGHKTQAPASVDSPQIFRGKHILLCEDHPLNQEIAKTLLEDKGMLVDIAENGEVGVEHFSRSAISYYDAILMDIRMPVLDGCEATRKIRALSRHDAQSIPIIAMTADAFAEDIHRFLDAGMNDHIPKPIDPNVLYGVLCKALSGEEGRRISRAER